VAPIRTLESGVSSVIAAGEVVERPASVVKELVENALDAGATRVAIDLVDGGKASIRVDDDGAGIPAAELPLAAENFSTSKIREIDDLSRVETLGFRGEALASIRAVSVLAARSRARSEEIGRELRFRGAERTGDGPCVRTPGTEIVVERLFFNLPARRKFLRSGASELRRIVGIVQAYALAFPAVSFLLPAAGREVLSYPVSRLDDRVEIVLGSELSGRMAKVEHEEGALRVSGYASQPDFTRSTRALQYFFVNRRFVTDRLLSHAVSQAYESLIPRNSYPALVLFVSIPPGGIDVNVHPAKAEVRFRDEAELHRVVRSAIRGAIGAARAGFAEAVEAAYGAIFPEGGSGAADAAAAIPR
jgi:DNA mismatch repair protein MutL